jgi:hypothetical protein
MQYEIKKGDRVKFWSRQHDDYLHGVVISDGCDPLFGAHNVECEGDLGVWSVPDQACILENP